MIIYEETIGNFIKECQPKNHDILISKIKSNMKYKIGRGVSFKEEESWRTTLTKIGSFFQDLTNKDDQYILLEFKIPTTQKRVDVILLGSDGKRKSLLIIELKGWTESMHSEIEGALKINTVYGSAVSHPSREAEEYKYLLSNQYSDITDEYGNLEAVSLLPNYEALENDPLLSEQFEALIEYIKVYTKDNIDHFKILLSKLFKQGIKRKDVDFLNKLEYKPTLDFQQHLEKQFEDIKLSTSQEIAFNNIKKQIDIHLSDPSNKKLITISGMPGSGKTIVAFKVLGYIYSHKKMTAKLQLPGPEFRNAVKSNPKFKANTLVNMISGAHSKSETEVNIVDEAHKAYGQANATAYYKQLFKNQNFVIALIDDNQVISKKSFTKSQVQDLARIHNFDIIDLMLNEQFRNGGDATYVDWLKNWIFDEDNQQLSFVNNYFDFNVLDDAEFHSTYLEMYKDYNVRMASFWTQKWNADFDDENKPLRKIKIGSMKYIWNPNNYWVNSFLTNNPDKKVPKDFKKEVVNKNFNLHKKGPEYVAYFNTIQGSEFDYIFVHVPKLFYLDHNNKLSVDLNQLDMTDMRTQIWTKNNMPNDSKKTLNDLYFKNRLLVNLTRGTKGVYIYCEDDKLQKWIHSKIIKSKIHSTIS